MVELPSAAKRILLIWALGPYTSFSELKNPAELFVSA